MPPAEAAARVARARVAGHSIQPLQGGWELAASEPGAHADAGALEQLRWMPASVPGTVAGALREAARWRTGDERDLDAEDWWFRTGFEAEPAHAGEELLLTLDGVATVHEIYLNGELIAEGESMFASHTLEIGSRVRLHNEIAICCRALAPMLGRPRKPRARWRTRIADGGLRFYRTMLLGRTPGFAPGPPAIGPWRAVALERRRLLALDELEVRPRILDGGGRLSVSASVRALQADQPIESVVLELEKADGTDRRELALALERDQGGVRAHGELQLGETELWWPHTHGEPALHRARLRVTIGATRTVIELGRTGFRSLRAGPAAGHELERDGLDIHVNGVRVFARGAVWTPLDIVGLAPSPDELRRALEQVRDAGMNMVRLPGTGAYESALFHDLCDELGIMVWQDLMFANFDYPIDDERFRDTVERELGELVAALGARPSLTVVCGNSEVEQQVAMLGLDPSLGRGELFGKLAPELVRELDAIYVPSAPCGGELPFRPDRGVANYYGVGGYRRPVQDARRAEVRFAAECLAFANVPEESTIQRMFPDGAVAAHHPAWKAGVPRDVGADWDFEDVRDHYLRERYGLDPAELRRAEHDRYLELSRMLTGEVMSEVLGEWRRSQSPCGGALVLWLRDLLPGAGWGLLDDAGTPKVAYHHLRRALAPVAVWLIDEGLGGLVAHVANDLPTPLRASLRIALYSGFSTPTEHASVELELPAHSHGSWNVETLIGRFLDVSWAYRFGPLTHDAIVASLEVDGDGGGPLSQAVHFPGGPPRTTQDASALGLSAHLRRGRGDGLAVVLSSSTLAYGVRISAPDHVPADDAFSLEPGHERVVALRADGPWSAGHVSALNLRGRVSIAALAK
jgi:beta-mannosidase